MARRFEVKKIEDKFHIVHMGTDTLVTDPRGVPASGDGYDAEADAQTRLDQLGGDAAYLMSAPVSPEMAQARDVKNAEVMAERKKAVGMTQAERERRASGGERVAAVDSSVIREVEEEEKRAKAPARRRGRK